MLHHRGTVVVGPTHTRLFGGLFRVLVEFGHEKGRKTHLRDVGGVEHEDWVHEPVRLNVLNQSTANPVRVDSQLGQLVLDGCLHFVWLRSCLWVLRFGGHRVLHVAVDFEVLLSEGHLIAESLCLLVLELEVGEEIY